MMDVLLRQFLQLRIWIENEYLCSSHGFLTICRDTIIIVTTIKVLVCAINPLKTKYRDAAQHSRDTDMKPDMTQAFLSWPSLFVSSCPYLNVM